MVYNSQQNQPQLCFNLYDGYISTDEKLLMDLEVCGNENVLSVKVCFSRNKIYCQPTTNNGGCNRLRIQVVKFGLVLKKRINQNLCSVSVRESGKYVKHEYYKNRK